MKLVSVSEMRAIEQEANASGLTYETMMENAGRNLAQKVMELSFFLQEEANPQVVGLVGPGNNGGDTLVALSHLAEHGWTAQAYLVKRTPDDALVARLAAAGGEVFASEQDKDFQQLRTLIEEADVLLDGVLGTGVQLPIKAETASVLKAASEIVKDLAWTPFVVAVDCPSGVDCDTGAAAPETIPANATVTMAAVKRGLLSLPAYERIGELHVVEIGDLSGLPTWQSLQNEVADAREIASLLPKRKLDAHKGTFGTALIVAGSMNYTGAALLAGKAAYRIGAGLVTLAVPSPLHTALAGHLPEATWLLLPHEMGVIAESAAEVLAKHLERVTALLIGPGLGLEDATADFLERFLAQRPVSRAASRRIGFLPKEDEVPQEKERQPLPPLIFDADGLKLLAKLENWPARISSPAILTPHPGEMSVLTGLTVEEIQRDRLETARRFAQTWGHVVVLKGAFTVIASPDGRTTTIPVATPALARAGSGDVLAGIITGLRAQGLEAYPAAVAGAWIHAQAGLAAARVQRNAASVLAGDLLESMPEVLSEMM